MARVPGPLTWFARIFLLLVGVAAIDRSNVQAAVFYQAEGPGQDSAGQADLEGEEKTGGDQNAAETAGRRAADGAASERIGSSPEVLPQRQRQVAESFEQFQAMLLRLSELSEVTDPRRAAMFRRAVRQAEDRALAGRLMEAAEMLSSGRLQAAAEEQQRIIDELRALLNLLLSEDRERLLRAEKQRLEAIAREVGELLRRQKDLQARTALPAQASAPLERQQHQLAEDTGRLIDQLGGRSRTQEGSPSAESPGGKATDPMGGSEVPVPGQPGEQALESLPEDFGQRSPGENQPSSSPGGLPAGSEGSVPSSEALGSPDNSALESSTPSDELRQRLEAARKRMLEAEKRLAEAKREGAIAEQEEAIRELEAAKAELERILRQYRQEELGRLLANLETRFRRMLGMQQAVYNETVRLAGIEPTKRTREDELALSRLGRQQSSIGLEATQALALLREDATAASMIEAVEQLVSDIGWVEKLFAEGNLGPLNQATQQAIIAALKELLQALEEAQLALESAEQSSGGEGMAGEQPLVDLLAELRMLRNLQARIYQRTQQLGEWAREAPRIDERLMEAFQDLAQRQERLHRIARELGARIQP